MATGTGAPGARRLSRGVLGRAAILAVLALVPAILGAIAAGPEVAAGVGIGLGIGLSAGLLVSPAIAAALALVHVGFAAAGILVGPSPAAAAVVVAVAALAVGPANRLGIGHAVLLLPLVAAVAASGALAGDLGKGLGGVALGAFWAVLLTARVQTRRSPKPLPVREAWIHAVALAVTCAAATWASLSIPLVHGYWIVATLCAVLVPAPGETALATAERVGGTLIGALVGAFAGVLLPRPLLGLAVFGSTVLLIGYALTGAGRRKVLWLTVLTVLLLGGLAGAGSVSVALERFALTLAGAALVALVGLGVAWLDRVTAASGPKASPA